MKSIGRLVVALTLCGFPLAVAPALAAQQSQNGTDAQIPENWEDPAQELPTETQVPAGEDSYAEELTTQESVIPSDVTGATEQDSQLPAEPSEDVIPSDPALEPHSAPEEEAPPLDQQETQIPQEPGAVEPELPPASEGAPVLIIPVNPDGEEGEESSGETQLLIIPLEPSEEQPLPQDELQTPPEQPMPGGEDSESDPEQVYIQ